MVASCVTTRSTSVCLEYFRRELFHSLRTDKLPRLYQVVLFLLFHSLCRHVTQWCSAVAILVAIDAKVSCSSIDLMR
jgi:hypothetical protein